MKEARSEVDQDLGREGIAEKYRDTGLALCNSLVKDMGKLVSQHPPSQPHKIKIFPLIKKRGAKTLAQM